MNYKRDAFLLAESFYLFACDRDDESYDFFFPAVVNTAFACELFLKALIATEDTKEIKGHRWERLFDALSENLKKEILHHPKMDGRSNFKEELVSAGKIFSDWRYTFEPGKHRELNLIFLSDIAEALYEIAKKQCSIHPQQA